MLAPIAPQQIVWQRARSPLRSPYSKATRLVLVADGRSAASGMPDEVHVIDESKMREKITEFGNSIARQQEADFLTAQERLLQAQADKSADQSDAAAPAARQTQPSTNDITAAVREELQRAKEYQNQLQNSAAATEDTACCPDLYDMDQTCAAGQTAGGGNAAAGFLANVLAKPASSPQSDIRPEKFTQLQEEARKHNTEIITTSQGYEVSGGVSSDGHEYRPKVSTWGMFPRPRDISKAFGGGRTLRPGQELEREDQRAERADRVAQALSKFKAASGLEVDPVKEDTARTALDNGRQLFAAGQLREALPRFEEAADLLPLRTIVGGEARLQQAISLDSLGFSEEARLIYISLKSHPSAYVSKTVKRLLGGFEAAEFLKADKFSYRADTQAYQQYFRSVESLYNTVYVKEGPPEDLTKTNAAAAAIVLGPLLALFLYIVYTSS